MAGRKRVSPDQNEVKVKVDKRKKNGLYNRPEVFEKGIILTDLRKNKWQIEDLIGEGGFGAIYSATQIQESKVSKDAKYAIKIEPGENGPLFTEMHFFIRLLKPEMIQNWMKQKKINFLGVPEYFGHGSLMHKNVNHRFVVMTRFGNDITTRLYGKDKRVDYKVLSTFSGQIIDALNYIHDNGYVHGDIKSDNLLLKYNSKENHVYLVDYGLVHSFYKDTEFKPDKKCQHNGTIEFCSRDAHLGRSTKRGDMEVFAYNLISWCGFKLPWINTKNPDEVHKEKIEFVSKLSKGVIVKAGIPAEIYEYFAYVKGLQHTDTPDYDRVKKMLSKLNDNVKKGTRKTKMSVNERGEVGTDEIEENSVHTSANIVDDSNSEEERTPITRKRKEPAKKKQTQPSWRDFPTIKASKQPGPVLRSRK